MGRAPVRWLLAVLFFALPALLPTLSQASEFPALFHVVDVASDDVLNVRALPDAASPTIDSFAFDYKRVEVIAITDDRSWGLVNVGEVSGWVSMRYLQPSSDLKWAYDQVALYCFGTEPFWSADLFTHGHEVEFQFFDDPPERFDVAWTARPENYTGDVLGFGASGDSGTLFGTIRNDQCSDGMSDRTFGLTFEAYFVRGGQPIGYRGCCSLTW